VTTTTAAPADPVTFSFGENWEGYLAGCFSEERLRIAKDWLLGFLELPDLKGKRFIDVGCGSGLSSLAAHDAGADRLFSFDVDPASVRATTRLRELRKNASHWDVANGSVLDPAYVAGLGTWDIVYSWGVLHHTGRMWDAVRNAATLVRPDGLFYIALYTTDHSSEFWKRIKLRYNRAGRLRKRYMEYAYVWHDLVKPNLFHPGRMRAKVRDYKTKRGMDYMHDVRDWLGGYPFEHARVEEVMRFGQDELGFRLVNLKTGEACTEYMFAAPDHPRWALRRRQPAHGGG
jgi:2-polyprenyl-6-hydroxyphenyl methylase/3-demethylubiquinone-9 3-methyltransferase